MMQLYYSVCHSSSRLVTRQYSTSFYSAIKLLHKDLQQPIHDIYGFVRLADEIVDTFHAYDKAQLLEKFSEETWQAINNGISLNPILHSFQYTVNHYNIPHDLIKAFLHSMWLDLSKSDYTTADELNEYIYGSAEVVGLMCLCVFCEGNAALYARLKKPAQYLGAAFQKVNFLRDIQTDKNNLNRTYFPELSTQQMDDITKRQIESAIAEDFKKSLTGIRQLPWKARLGVYTAYRYYYALFKKIKQTQPQHIMQIRIRVPDYQKIFILLQAGVHNKLNMI